MDSTDTQLRELLGVILAIYGRQMALLELVKGLGVTQEQMDVALKKAKRRLQAVPALAHPSTLGPSTLQGLSGLLYIRA
jgi:hypothetical protein